MIQLQGTEQLVVKILKALDLPAKDANGFSDPYVKIYLLPDRKKKYQTKVHRKTLNPVFNETFQFGVPLNELHSRKLHFSVYDFDRFSRHDLIGQVVVDNLLDFSEGSGDKPVWRDIVEGTAFTAPADPYVKASLICDGRRLKKRKTSIKKNTLNPTYNEALVFDIPNENIESVSIIIAVMDYDCIGHNEVIGMCRVGSDADGPGREHWTAMLANPRKPIEHWHQLVENLFLFSQEVIVQLQLRKLLNEDAHQQQSATPGLQQQREREEEDRAQMCRGMTEKEE
ncbi:hypothetical protein FQN60_004159 [Etheostoma spectabile]|uniref:C2 domain-containing protein n=1 Tax=Etheostoma spectabile TaxID=54343 RepID=A0A5J5CYT5_9PERO|nr:hypothetical protein FQN60_004159 [Etheostoma spectabile]